MLHIMHLCTIFCHFKTFILGGKLRGRAMLIGGTNEQNIMALLALMTGIDIRWQKRTNQVAQMLDAIDVG